MSDEPISNGTELAKDTRFKPGQIANPKGRPKGSRNKLSEDFLKAMSSDFEEHGLAAVVKVRETSPAEYLRVVASILPKELNVKIDPLEEMTDDELIERLIAIRLATASVFGRVIQAGEGVGAEGENPPVIALPALH